MPDILNFEGKHVAFPNSRRSGRHVLPGKPGTAKPVIARFYCRNLKTLCLRKKRDFATKTSRGPPAAPGTTRANTGGVTV